MKIEDILSRLNSIKIGVLGNNSVQEAWECLNTQIHFDATSSFTVDKGTMGSRNLVKQLTQMNLNARNPKNITHGTLLHDQKISNLCVYFAILSAVRHEMKSHFIGLISNYVWSESIESSIPRGKSIDELLEVKVINGRPTALSYELMLSMMLGCVSPRALSGNGQNLKTSFFFQF